MKEGIHPTWYPEARVICACGNTWTTGSTKPEIKTDICSNCHPFYTGEQRIVDTEGQVDRFLKRLKARENIKQARETSEESKLSVDLALTEFELGTRNENVLADAGVVVVGDVIAKLEEGGDNAMLDIKGFGAKGLVDLKKKLRARGYELPES